MVAYNGKSEEQMKQKALEFLQKEDPVTHRRYDDYLRFPGGQKPDENTEVVRRRGRLLGETVLLCVAL